MIRATPARVLLAAWAVATLGIGVALTALHDVPLPPPATAALAASDRPTMIHALDTRCGCSKRLAEYLVGRGPTPKAHEIVLVSGEPAELVAQLRARGFDARAMAESEMQTSYQIESVPSLVIARADGSVAYRGAHRPRPQMDPADLDLLAEVESGASPNALAIFGCAVSRALQERIDPLGIKFGKWSTP